MGKHSAKSESLFKAVNRYAKFLVALFGAISATSAQLGINGVPETIPEWVTIGIYFATALGVYQVPNKETKKDVLQEV